MSLEAIDSDAPATRAFELPSIIGAEIARVLAESIIFLKLEPAGRITEEGVCGQFGVSRSPVREAFRMLEADGLIVRSARRGVRVAPMGLADLKEVYACRVALEGLAAAEAAKMADEATLERLRTLLVEMQVALERRDVATFFNRNVALTRAIHTASGNATLMRLLAGIDKQALRYRYFAHLRTHEMLELSYEGHGDVCAAIMARKPLLARRRAERVIRRAHGVIAQALTDAYPATASGQMRSRADAPEREAS